MNAFTPLEAAVIEKLLDADDPVMAVLRRQAEVATVLSREMTGVGFYTALEVPPNVERVANRQTFQFGDVAADIDGLQHGAGFLLYVKDGVLHLLEGYTYDEAWPQHSESFSLHYLKVPRDLPNLH